MLFVDILVRGASNSFLYPLGCLFGSGLFSTKKLKQFLVHLLWSETKSFFVDGPTTLLHFTDWVSTS